MIQVVCAIIRRQPGAPVLLCRRAPGRSWAGFFEFPGGKIEPGESHEQALARELQEELHLPPDRMTIGGAVAENCYEGGADGPALRLIALDVLLAPDFRLPQEPPPGSADIEIPWPVNGLPAHDLLAWVPAGSIASHKLPPADIPIAHLLDRP